MDQTARCDRERDHFLLQLQSVLEGPMVALAFVWAALLVYDFAAAPNRGTQVAEWIIWGVFVIDFLVELSVAPKKIKYFRKNWLTALALAVPALRVFRIFRLARALRILRVARGACTIRIFSSLNRTLRALRKSMGHRGFAYILSLTIIVNFAGAAGMYAFEKNAPGAAHQLDSYWSAVWWTTMILTTMGSQYWPQTPEGRFLCVFLAIYGFTTLGYFTAVLASVFISPNQKSANEPR